MVLEVIGHERRHQMRIIGQGILDGLADAGLDFILQQVDGEPGSGHQHCSDDQP